MLFHIQPYSTVQDNHPSSKEYPCQMKGYVVAVSQTGQNDAKINVHMSFMTLYKWENKPILESPDSNNLIKCTKLSEIC